MSFNDFSKRTEISEWMDGPCGEQELHDCLHDLEWVNRLVFVYQPTLRWLTSITSMHRAPLHIADVGCGGGDMLRAIERWAIRRSIVVKLTGVDMNERAIRFAQSRTDAASGIHYVHGNAGGNPDVRNVDLIISSHMTHHLSDNEIVRFLHWMEENARVGWFINDLHRERVPYQAFRLLARAMRWHRFIQHDGPVSVLRSFQPEDWERYLAAAEIHGAEIRTAWPGRLCVQRTIAHA